MKSSVRYGLLDGAAAIIWTMLMYVTELNRSDNAWIFNTLSMAVPITFMYLAINRYKTDNGFISFGTAFKNAFAVGIIGGLISALFMVVYIKYIDQGFMPFMMHKQELQMQEKGMDQEGIDRAMSMSAKFQTPGWILIWGLLGSLFVSAVLALIMAGILKKPDTTELN